MIELDEVALLLMEQRKLLEMIAMGEPTTESLTALCLAVPRLSPRTKACILLTDKSRLTFSRSIAPDFPSSFGEELARTAICADATGTCGLALFRGEQVACGDIASEAGPWSEAWRDLCLEQGVRACVSEPIQGPEGMPLGCFLLCFDEVRERTEWEQRMLKVSSFIASIALTRDQTAAALRQSEERYRTLFRSIHAGFCVLEMLGGPELDFRLLECNPMFQRMTDLKRPLGKTARALASGLDESWFELLAGVAVSGQSVGLEKRAWGRWYEVYSYRVDQARDGRIAVLFDDITHRKRNEMNLEFLASLSQDLNRENSSEVIMRAAGRSIGAFLDLTACAFKEVPEDAEQAPVVCTWQRDGMPDGAGNELLGKCLREEFLVSGRQGEPFVVRDTAKDGRVEKYLPLGIRAFVRVPVLRDEQLRFELCVYDEWPRIWRADEIELLRRLADRIWIRVERARTEEALFESERQLRQIFEAAKDYAIFSLDRGGYITSWSPGAERLFGYRAEEVMGQHSEMIFTPMDRAGQAPLREMELALKTGVAEDERWHLRKDGGRFFASGLLQPMHDRCGKHLGFTKICRDRTARQQSREWLERELVDSQRLQEISARLVAEGDFVSLLKEILQAAIAIVGADLGTVRLAEDESDGMGLRLLVSEGFDSISNKLDPLCSRQRVESFAERIWAGERVVVSDLMELYNLAASPTLVGLVEVGVRAFQWTPLISRSGCLLGTIATHWRRTHEPGQRELRLLDLLARQAADLIERHQSQAALREREQQLRELSQTLEKRVEQRTAELQEQAARLQRLAAELASAEQRERKRLAALLHDDLQQLLVAASMQLGLAGTSSGKAAGHAISQAAKWIEEARNAARDLTRELRPPALYEDGLIAALHWLASEMQKRHYLEVEIDGKEPARRLSDDTKALLFECVRELLFNSAKYAGVSRAKVVLREADGRLQLVVSDTGIGFDVKTIGTWRKRGGFGLFSIRERLIALGGEMIMISAPGKGTRVELHAPVDRVERVAASATTRQIELLASGQDILAAEPGSGCDPRIRVLVVDDHPMVREGIANILNSDSRLTVSGQAADGIEAISAVERHLPDVVLMDVNMPRMNGIEATRKIHRRWPETRIIGLSVQDDATTAKSMRDAGAAAFISKSGASEAMIAAILEQVPDKSRPLAISSASSSC